MSVSRHVQKHTCVMMGMGAVTADNRHQARRDERGGLSGQGRGRCLKGDRVFWSQCPIDESLPEWFNVLDPAEDSTGR